MKTILLTILSIFMLAEASVFYTSEKVKRIEKYLLVGILLFICSLTYGQNNPQVFKSPNKGDTIYYDPSNPPQVFKGGVEYLQTLKLT